MRVDEGRKLKSSRDINQGWGRGRRACLVAPCLSHVWGGKNRKKKSVKKIDGMTGGGGVHRVFSLALTTKIDDRHR